MRRRVAEGESLVVGTGYNLFPLGDDCPYGYFLFLVGLLCFAERLLHGAVVKVCHERVCVLTSIMAFVGAL